MQRVVYPCHLGTTAAVCTLVRWQGQCHSAGPGGLWLTGQDTRPWQPLGPAVLLCGGKGKTEGAVHSQVAVAQLAASESFCTEFIGAIEGSVAGMGTLVDDQLAVL